MPSPHYHDDDPQAEEDEESFDLPLGLKARCMRSYGWDEDFAGRALTGYRQFMQLKKQVEDWQAETLSPSLTIDFVWLQHISDVEHYVNTCMNYCGVLIGHNPEDGLDNSAAREERIRATKLSRKLVFGNDNVDAEVWSFGDDDVEEFDETDDTPRSRSRRQPTDSQGARRKMKSRHKVNNNHDEEEEEDDRISPRTVATQQFDNSRDMSRHMKSRRYPKQPKEYEDRYEDTDEDDYPDEYYDDDEEDGFFDDDEGSYERSDKIDKKKITVQVRDQKTGDTQRFRIRRHQKIGKLYQAYAKFNELPLDKCRFFFQCERIGPDLTVGSIGLYHEAIIELVRQKDSIW